CDHGGKLRFVCVAVSQTRLEIIYVCMPLLLHKDCSQIKLLMAGRTRLTSCTGEAAT
ncbi:unnamed protein product, partial [Brassica rapa subsp. narinosa]